MKTLILTIMLTLFPLVTQIIELKGKDVIAPGELLY